AIHHHQRDWASIVQRDANHPSIVAWTPFNETIGAARTHFDVHEQALRETIALTRALDPTRPVHDTSGYVHVEGSDIFTVHNYEQDPTIFAETYAGVHPDNPDKTSVCFEELSAPYRGQPYVVDEYGGTWWSDRVTDGVDRGQSWGYGNRPADIEEVYRRIGELTRVLTEHPQISGYCYTQLTDVEQEENGIYTYDRRLKFDADRLREAFAAPAAIEG
ncbi:MAG: beta-galactosidase, partial [Gemmatimonadetes bacterium]|nr:beta-galactosidase [Gemmatimonadota bacterium]